MDSFNKSLVSIFALAALAGPCLAAPITITDPFLNLENRGVNSLGFLSGTFFRFGANSVVPNGTAGTTGVGTTSNLLTGASVSNSINFDPGPVIPNFYARYLTANPALYGPWTLTFTNGTDTASALVTLPTGQAQAPFVNSITLSGTGVNPTFSWAPPPGTVVNGYRVNIYDKSLISPTSNGQVSSTNVSPGVTSHTVTAADFTVPGYAFQPDHNYSIEIGLIQTKDGSSTVLNNRNLAAISRVYADFRTSNTGGPAVNLPVTLENGSYKFNIAVQPGTTYYLDPAVAIGYDYRIGVGDASFRSVVLPAGIGDGLYDIFGLGANGATTLLAHDWAAGASFDFGAAGVDAFRVGGIEASAGIDPANVTGFVTGMTFTRQGLFTGTQTPITLDVAAAVPEPQTYALFALGLLAIGWRSRRNALPSA
jgi:PEP-CTERM motif